MTTAVGFGRRVAQKTLKRAIHCKGVGLHSGKPVTMRLLPAPADSGISFVRTDLDGAARAPIAARWNRVVDTKLCTVVANDAGASVGTIEHLMAALRGCDIDNAVIELDGPEVPAVDGSSEPFVFLIDCAGTVEQVAARQAIRVLKSVSVGTETHQASLQPGSSCSFSFEIDFASNAIKHQDFFFALFDGNFRTELAQARTFGFLHEVEALRAMGLARGGSLDNAIVVDGDRILNSGGLRYTDEFVRHKVLDCIGDLYLAGLPILGHFHGFRSGHALNNQLLHRLFADPTAWTVVPFTDADLNVGTGTAPAAAAAASFERKLAYA